MRIDMVPWNDPDASALRAGQRAEIAQRYGTPDSEPGVAPSADDIAVFVVARDERGTAVGCGGLRDLGDGTGEVKRMYVPPERRGSGAAPLVLAALEEWARERGWTCLRLETGDRQPDAVRFYTRAGYTPVPKFGAYADSPSSLCFGKVLPAPRP
ncbi:MULTISPECIES: GNAT family N-acetyltransferase [Nocardiopsis]|jgi:GNAT superfamily N-acetyltransferase|uniref:GNAT family N-acetyltransferase n=1 Tax=Nocardiopsis sinuspersici TaxID=501010 RepID=A0A1V3C0F0_9ACTN|nr:MULTISPECIES: GNAT family N-acetyltransferase [Nocardiopsis]NYH55571.1 GNAT superfamily N-acetyltransferase [Nocardiopsis sinuspersici]OOC54185.1 GNAT family N-acetyltransferase [Nocardiopsis sinuspersici]